MKIRDLVIRLRPGEKLYISVDTWVNDDGERTWTGPLTEAQMLAYWNHTIGPMTEENGNLRCIIYFDRGGGDVANH